MTIRSKVLLNSPLKKTTEFTFGGLGYKWDKKSPERIGNIYKTLGMHIPVSLSGSFFIFLISFVMMGYWLALSLVLT